MSEDTETLLEAKDTMISITRGKVGVKDTIVTTATRGAHDSLVLEITNNRASYIDCIGEKS